MILFVDDNAGVLFHKWTISGAIKKYITGTIDTLSVVVGSIKGHGLLVGVVNANSLVGGRMIGHAKISGTINTFTRVLGALNTQIVIEIIRFESYVKRVLRINSKC